MTGKSERQFIEQVTKHDYVAMRAPGSGGAPNHEAGDIWVAKGTEYGTDLYVIEEKYCSTKGTGYGKFESGKTERMMKTAEEMGATPLFAIRWSTREWDVEATHYIGSVQRYDPFDQSYYSFHARNANALETIDDYFGD